MRGVEQIGHVYDVVVKPMNRLGLGNVRRELVGRLAGDILEIGVGTGLNLGYYGPDARVTALDPDEGLLSTARERAAIHRAKLMLADAQQLPFLQASFDAVVSTLVFCSIPDPALALEEIRRVLRPGGSLMQIEHTLTGRRWIDTGLNAIAPAWRVVTGGCHLNRDTAALLDASGWKIERHERRAGGLIRLLVSKPPKALPTISFPGIIDPDAM